MWTTIQSRQRGRAVTLWWSVPVSLLALATGTLALTGCELATPFRGDGFAPGKGVVLPDVGDRVVVGITHAVLDGANRRTFDDYTQRVIKNLPGAPGYIGHSVRTKIFGNEVWTMTVWRDEASLEEFVRSPTHRAAMREGMSAITRAQFDRLPWPAIEVPPSWRTIKEHLKTVPVMDYSKPQAER